MARLASRIKLGFYPTPPPVADAVATFLRPMGRNARIKFLDPCCGDGQALARIRQRLLEQHTREYERFSSCAVSTWGIELDQVRAQEAEEHLDHVLGCSFFSTTLSTGESADRGWQFVYVNPPYDNDSESREVRKTRQEFAFLKRATDRLCHAGILAWVIPEYVLLRKGVTKYLAERYDQLRCYRFPDATWVPPDRQKAVSMREFQQVIVFGRKLPTMVPAEPEIIALIQQWARLGQELPPLPVRTTEEAYVLPDAPSADTVKLFLKGSFNPDAAAARIGIFDKKSRRPEAGVWANEDYWTARFPDPRKAGISIGHPMHAFKKGYLIVFAVAGIVNQAVLTGKDGRRILVKGHVRKTVHQSTTDDGMEIVEKQTDRFESSLWCLDLETMELILIETGEGAHVGWSVEHETMTMNEFLTNFGDSLMEQVTRLNAPRYQRPEQVPWAMQALAQVKRTPLGKQLDVILAHVHALVNRWQEGDLDEDELLERIAVVAEMASGKTYIAMVSAFLADLSACGVAHLATPSTRLLPFFPAIVLSPSIMAPKWKREFEQTLPNARVLIVERFGPARGNEEDDEDDEDLRVEAQTPSFSDARTAFRAFDPGFTGSSLGLIGSVDRAVEVIKAELAEWQQNYDAVVAQNLLVQEGNALAPLPLKPCHVLILTFTTAKMMPQWMCMYRMKLVRARVKDTDTIHLLRRKNEERSPVCVPACPHCFRAIKDERSLKKWAGDDVQERSETRREIRLAEGKKLGIRLLAAEERLERHLSTHEAYRTLRAEREAFLLGETPQDAQFLRTEECITALLARQPEYQTLVAQRDQANTNDERKDHEQQINSYLNHLLVSNKEYRQLIIEQDHRFRALQLACEERREAFLQTIAQTDETYQELCVDADFVREEYRHFPFRLEAYEEELSDLLSLYVTENDLQGSKDHRVKRSCSECGEPLWQYVAMRPRDWKPFSVLNVLPIQQSSDDTGSSFIGQHLGTTDARVLPLPSLQWLPSCVKNTYKRRYAMAEHIADHYSDVFHLLIADEVHEGADGTALDQARQVLANACGHLLGLTGTLSNGYASSLFRLYYVIMRQVRKDFEYSDVHRWIKLHGKMRTTQKSRYETPPTGTGSDSKRKINPGMPVTREIAGFDASGMGRVARVSTLTELSDVVKDMVKYQEEIHYIPMGDVLGPAYERFQMEATQKLRDLLSSGDNSGLSPWFYALWIYPDMPWLGFDCKTKDGVLLGTAPKLPAETVWPIEEAIINYIKEQHHNGYRVLVYTERTGTYDEQQRLKELFEKYVRGRGGRKLKVMILRSTTTKKSMDREAWLDQAVKDGVDVLICNPQLVKVGLDLLAFPRIVYKSFPRKTSDLRQSSRRSLRPGQTQDVEVAFFAYEESMALRLLFLMARKTLSSLMVEGKIASEGLVSLGFQEEEEEGEIVGMLAREMVRALTDGTINETGQIAAALQQAALDSARIELEQNQEVGAEPDASHLLVEEIRRAPLPPLVAIDEPVPVDPPTQMELRYETIVPLPITSDPSRIFAEAGVDDAWAALIAQYGVGGKKGRQRKKK